MKLKEILELKLKEIDDLKEKNNDLQIMILNKAPIEGEAKKNKRNFRDEIRRN